MQLFKKINGHYSYSNCTKTHNTSTKGGVISERVSLFSLSLSSFRYLFYWSGAGTWKHCPAGVKTFQWTQSLIKKYEQRKQGLPKKLESYHITYSVVAYFSQHTWLRCWRYFGAATGKPGFRCRHLGLCSKNRVLCFRARHPWNQSIMLKIMLGWRYNAEIGSVRWNKTCLFLFL